MKTWTPPPQTKEVNKKVVPIETNSKVKKTEELKTQHTTITQRLQRMLDNVSNGLGGSTNDLVVIDVGESDGIFTDDVPNQTLEEPSKENWTESEVAETNKLHMKEMCDKMDTINARLHQICKAYYS